MLRVEGLHRTVGDFHLRVDDWHIAEGQYVVLVGPSGSGKTMLLETLAGLVESDGGRIRMDGIDVTDATPEDRRVGYVYQDCWLFPHLTVRRNIGFGQRYRQTDGSALTVEELAEVLHISGLLDRMPSTLSGGERQRVALARALAVRPRLLFLDEPLGALDPVTRERVSAELLNCHRAMRTTTVHVTHDHQEARMLGDATAVILGGRLEQTGPTDEIFRRPRSRELAVFLGCENVFDATARSADAEGVVQLDLGGRKFRLPGSSRGRVAVCVRPEDVQVTTTVGASESPGAASGRVELPGRVLSVSDRGPMVRLVVEARGESWVSLIGLSEQRSRRIQPGDAVTLCVPHEALHIIEPE